MRNPIAKSVINGVKKAIGPGTPNQRAFASLSSVMDPLKVQAPKQMGTPGYDPQPMPSLADPDNPQSEITPADLLSTPTPPPVEAKRICDFVTATVTKARFAQMAHHPRMFTAWSFEMGEQWRIWNGQTGTWQSQKIGAGDAGYSANFPRRYMTFNTIKPLVLHTQSKALETDPSAGFSPLTPSKQDVAATKQARAVDAHVTKINKLTEMQEVAVKWAEVVSAPVAKVYYDPTKTYLKPIYGDILQALPVSAAAPQMPPQGIPQNGPTMPGQPTQGLQPGMTPQGPVTPPQSQVQPPPTPEIIKAVDAPGGDICIDLLSPFEWLGDPKAKSFEEMAYIIHYQIVPLSFVQLRYKLGWTVEPDAQMSDTSGVEARQAIVTGDYNRNTSGKMDGVALAEYWEVASARYPWGRVITVANGVLLDYQERMPDTDGKKLPFHRLPYDDTLASIYDRNAVSDLIDAQILTNKAANKLAERLDESTYFIMAAEGSEPDIDMARTDRVKTTYFYKSHDAVTKQPYPEPHFAVTPNEVSPLVEEVLQFADNYRRDSIGIHDVSDGQLPSNVKSGVAIAQLKSGDDTQLANFIKHIRSWRVNIAETVLSIAQKKYLEDRLLMVQDSSDIDPDEPRTQALDYKALANGRVVISPSSASLQNPLARQQTLHDMQTSGAFNPDQLPITRLLLKLYDIEGADKLYDDIGYVLDQQAAKEAAAQPDPAALQAQQAAQAQQALQLQQAHDAALAQVQTEAKLQLLQAEGEIDAKTASQVAQIKAQSDAQAQELKAKIQAQSDEHKAQLEAANMAAEHAHELHMQQLQSQSEAQMAQMQSELETKMQLMLAQFKFEHPQLAGAMDGVGVEDLESKIGIKGEAPELPDPNAKTDSANSDKKD